MSRDNGNHSVDEERVRAYRHISSQLKGARRPLRDVHAMANRIITLAEEDIDGWCPNNYEQIMACMNQVDRILEFLTGYLRDILNKAIKVNFYGKGLDSVTYETEDLRQRLINLRLDLMNWAKKFETPNPSVPTPEEEAAAEAEKAEAYRTKGASLLRQEPQGEAGEASDG